MSRYGIGYMGSKEKILHMIDDIFQREYKKTYLIDLFCGGLSVTSYALQKTKYNVIANDLNKYVIALYKEMIYNHHREFDKIKYEWISREQFDDVKENPENYPDWYVGYVLNVWSFGYNQRDYLYAKDLEEDKKAVHYALVFDDWTYIKNNPLFEGFEVPQHICEMPYDATSHKRNAFLSYLKDFIRDEDKSDRAVRQIQLERLVQLSSLTQMEHIHSIKPLEKKVDRLTLLNMDYLEVYNAISKDILENAVIYCDPPYEDTKKYLEGGNFNHEEFWQWFRDCPYPVYVSSYKAPDDIKPLDFELKQVNLDNGSKNNGRYAEKKKAVENIYWNGKGNPEPLLVDLLFG